MVIPLPQINVQGDPPPECAEDMKRLKYAVIAMIATGGGRLFFSFVQGVVGIDLFALLNLFMSITIGTFVFKDDSQLRSFYNCLAGSICQPCAESSPGGMACLVPLMFVSLLNAIFDLLMRYPLVSLMPYGIFLVGSIVAQATTGYLSWLVFKVVREVPPDQALEMGGYGDRGRHDAPPHQDFNAGHANTTDDVARSSGVVPFSGTGQRLGS
mmetsp:Transcript_48550/g.135681  ORF Transcript_48550/g.135681 Transcript_48550/m.135681 type:complete len:212 (-) Transcript_48550:79-714(-)